MKLALAMRKRLNSRMNSLISGETNQQGACGRAKKKGRARESPWIHGVRDRSLLKVVPEHPAAARVAQPAERLALNLANALARQAELAANLFERIGAPVDQAVAQAQNARLARAERAEHFFDLLVHQALVNGLSGRGRRLVLDERA